MILSGLHALSAMFAVAVDTAVPGPPASTARLKINGLPPGISGQQLRQLFGVAGQARVGPRGGALSRPRPTPAGA